MIKKIVSGGQSGVDRAALDVALELRIPCGGWCPKGRKAEDGIIDRRYPLRETESADYAERTRLNVEDSDGTLILTWGKPTRGTRLTTVFAMKSKKPYLIVNLDEGSDTKSAQAWILENKIEILNVAGPRESFKPGVVYEEAMGFLKKLLL